MQWTFEMEVMITDCTVVSNSISEAVTSYPLPYPVGMWEYMAASTQ